MLVDRTRREHQANDKQSAHHGDKGYSVAVNRWLDEPVADGPYNGIAGVAGWRRQVTDEGIETTERKKKSSGKEQEEIGSKRGRKLDAWG